MAMRYTYPMSDTWNLVLAINSAIWTFALGFLTYACCMLFIALEWQQFLFALILFIATSLVETIVAIAQGG